MKTKNKTCLPSAQRPLLPRTHRVSFLLNEEEKRVIDRYIEKYNVANVSKFMREAVVRTALHQLDEDRPTLFDQQGD